MGIAWLLEPARLQMFHIGLHLVLLYLVAIEKAKYHVELLLNQIFVSSVNMYRFWEA